VSSVLHRPAESKPGTWTYRTVQQEVWHEIESGDLQRRLRLQYASTFFSV
jgi:hypothetical protein